MQILSCSAEVQEVKAVHDLLHHRQQIQQRHLLVS